MASIEPRPSINFRIPIATIEQKLEGIRAQLAGKPADLTAQLAASLALKKVSIPDAHCKVGKSYSAPASPPAPARTEAPATASAGVQQIIQANTEAGVADRLSPSQVRTFTDCQARWKYEKVDGLTATKGPNLALGIAAHEALAYNFTQKIDSRKDLPAGDVLTAFDVAWQQVQTESDLHGRAPEELQQTGAGLLRKFMAEAAPRIQPAAVEHEVYGEIGGVKVSGRVDLIDRDAMIHDFKTVRSSPSGLEPAQMFQLATYTRLAGTPGQVRVHALVKNKTPKLVQITRTVEPEDFTELEIRYPLIQEAMRSGLYVPNRGSNLCSRENCSFWRECEIEFGGRVPA